MAQFYTDFQEFNLDTEPTGWTKDLNPTEFTMLMKNDASSNKHMQIERQAGTNSIPKFATWDIVGTPTDVETFGIFSTSASPTDFARPAGVAIRITGTSSTANYHYANIFKNADPGVADWRQSYSNLSSSTVTGNHSGTATFAFSWVADTIYAFRYRANGTTHTSKIWQPANPLTNPTADEPGAWSVSTTTSNQNVAGRVGFGLYTAGLFAKARLYRFGVGTAGDTAPSASVGGGGQLATPSSWTFVAGSGLRQLIGSWQSVAGASTYEYEVQRWNGSTWVGFATNTIPGTTFTLTSTDGGVEWSTLYRARVRARPA
jgi:hypothetical protein